MARLEDISEGERELMKTLPLPSFDTTPFVKGKPLSQRRVSILSTAALQKRDDKVFYRGEALGGPHQLDRIGAKLSEGPAAPV